MTRRTLWLRRVLIGGPVLALMTTGQIGRAVDHGSSIAEIVATAVAGVLCVFVVWAMVSLVQISPALRARKTLRDRGTGAVVFVARTTPAQLKILRGSRRPVLSTYFVVVAGADGVGLWNPLGPDAPYAQQSWSEIDAVTASSATLNRWSVAYSLEITARSLFLPTLILIPSREWNALAGAPKKGVDAIVEQLEHVRLASASPSTTAPD